ILVEDWSNSNTSFSMELSNDPGSAGSAEPDGTIDLVGPFCVGESPVQLTAANMGGDWTGTGITNSGEFDPTAAGAGTHTIDYEVGTAPCDDTDQIQITVNAGSTVTAEVQGGGNSITICEGESVDIEATGSSTYDWDNGLGAGATHTVSPTTTTDYTVEGTDANGCIDTDVVTVNVSPAVTIDVSPDEVICATASTDIEATATGGSMFDYHWSHTGNTDGIQTVTPGNPSTYTVYAENEYGCESGPEDIEIDIHPEPTGTVSDDQTICPGDSVNISAIGDGGAGGPYTYTWQDENGDVISNQDNFYVKPTSTSTYIVEVNDNCGTLPITMDVEVVVSPLPDVSFSVNEDKQCRPALFEVTNNTPSDLVEEAYWYLSDGQEFNSTDTIDVYIEDAGEYDLELVVVTPDGCVDSASVNDFLTVHPSPRADFSFVPDPVTMLNTEVTFYNHSYGAENYEWTFESGDPATSTHEEPVIFFPEGEIEKYEVQLVAISEYDCPDTMNVTIQVESEVLIYAPNAFTPDGDDFNPTWRVYINGIDVQDFDLEIYNRWGEMVWESHNPEVGWDGTYGGNGQKVKGGTYIWKVRTRDYINDKKYEWQGHVTVLD
ncbi:MAG: gliding motility-associated C-terminal domain-containing protein, partial [Brumimicrobium sp.]